MNSIPHDGYWRTAGQVFQYPLLTVFAGSQAEADKIAGPEHVPATYDQVAYLHLALECAEAQHRLGIWGRPDLAAQIERGDSPSNEGADRMNPAGLAQWRELLPCKKKTTVRFCYPARGTRRYKNTRRCTAILYGTHAKADP